MDEKELRNLLLDGILLPVLVAFFVAALAGLEWLPGFNERPPSPLMSVLALVMVAFAAWKVFEVWPQIRRLRRARDGERVMGQSLERLRGRGYRVFDDVRGSEFDIDHVVIGPTGVFAIETGIMTEGPDTNSTAQARAQSNWLQELLGQITGHDFDVRPVIVSPASFTEPRTDASVAVLEPKGLPGFLEREPVVLDDVEVGLASFQLARFMRSRAPS